MTTRTSIRKDLQEVLETLETVDTEKRTGIFSPTTYMYTDRIEELWEDNHWYEIPAIARDYGVNFSGTDLRRYFDFCRTRYSDSIRKSYKIPYKTYFEKLGERAGDFADMLVAMGFLTEDYYPGEDLFSPEHVTIGKSAAISNEAQTPGDTSLWITECGDALFKQLLKIFEAYGENPPRFFETQIQENDAKPE